MGQNLTDYVTVSLSIFLAPNLNDKGLSNIYVAYLISALMDVMLKLINQSKLLYRWTPLSCNGGLAHNSQDTHKMAQSTTEINFPSLSCLLFLWSLFVKVLCVKPTSNVIGFQGVGDFIDVWRLLTGLKKSAFIYLAYLFIFIAKDKKYIYTCMIPKCNFQQSSVSRLQQIACSVTWYLQPMWLS